MTILELFQKKIAVKAIAGDDHLGGQDVDIRLLEWARREFNNDSGKTLPTDDKRINARLRKACNKVKHELTNAHSSVFDIEQLYDGEDM